MNGAWRWRLGKLSVLWFLVFCVLVLSGHIIFALEKVALSIVSVAAR